MSVIQFDNQWPITNAHRLHVAHQRKLSKTQYPRSYRSPSSRSEYNGRMAVALNSSARAVSVEYSWIEVLTTHQQAAGRIPLFELSTTVCQAVHSVVAFIVDNSNAHKPTMRPRMRPPPRLVTGLLNGKVAGSPPRERQRPKVG